MAERDEAEAGLLRLTTSAAWALVAAVLVACVGLALTVPYHAADSLSYGEWSRRIDISGGFHFPTVGQASYARPLFYVTQGWIWRDLGFAQPLGRLWSLAFAIVFFGAMVALVRQQRLRSAAPLVVLALLAAPDVMQNLLSGQTDVPVAGLIAVCGVLALRSTPVGVWCALAIAASSCAAMLTKPSALPALGGLALAAALGPRPELAGRLLRRSVPVAAGLVVALLYDLTQARHVGVSLYNFLTGSNPGQNVITQTVARFDATGGGAGNGAAPNSTAFTRPNELLSMQWLGPFLPALLGFAVAYAVLRAVGLVHRRAALVAAGASVALTWVGPSITGAEPPWSNATVFASSLVLAVGLWLAARCADAQAPSRVLLARCLVWALPTVAAWVIASPYDLRLLSPAWPPAFVLLAVCGAMAIAGAGSWRPWASAVLLMVVLALAAYDTRNVDSLGTRADQSNEAWTAALSLSPGDWLHPSRTLRAADPQLADLLASVRSGLGPGRSRAITDDARLRFFLLDRIDRRIARDCAALRTYRLFVWEPNPTQLAPESYWLACRHPRARVIHRVSGVLTVFAITDAGR